MKTHRCEKSLENKMSIRFTKKYAALNWKDDYKTWRLFRVTESDYSFEKYLEYICKIDYCPFCGQELK